MKATRLFLLAFVLLITACAGLMGGNRREGVSSSLVDYLYPAGEKPPPLSAQTAVLELPLKVGLAFVPSQYGSSKGPSEAERMEMLQKVKTTFSGRDFIEEIAVIPEAYLRAGRGFEGLEQTARLYGLDVMALVSYDQVANTSEKAASLLYWTIVGAYVVKGNKNDAQTFVDTAVFDIATRKLLFRAPGVSDVQSSTTLVDQEQDMRVTQRKGFEQAMADMTKNLDTELASFKERIRTDGSVKVTRTSGYSSGGGGGALDAGLLALLAGLLFSVRRATRV